MNPTTSEHGLRGETLLRFCIFYVFLFCLSASAQTLNVKFQGSNTATTYMTGSALTGFDSDSWNGVSFGLPSGYIPSANNASSLKYADGTGSLTLSYTSSPSITNLVQYPGVAAFGASPNSTLYTGHLSMTNGVHGVGTGSYVIFTVSGLGANTKYNLSLYAGTETTSAGPAGPGTQTSFTVNGVTQSVTYAAGTAYAPGTNCVTFSGLQSDASGNLTFTWNFNSNSSGYSNLFQGFQMEAIGPGMGRIPPGVLGVQFGASTSVPQTSLTLLQFSPYNVPSPASVVTAPSGIHLHTFSGSLSFAAQCNTAGATPDINGWAPRSRPLASGDQGPYTHLFQSFLGSTRTDLRLAVSGLMPYTTYQIQTWAWDRTNGGLPVHFRVFDKLAADASKDQGTWVGSITATGGTNGNTPTSLSLSSLTFLVTADSEGKIIFGPSKVDAFGTVTTGSPIINGFVITAPPQNPLTQAVGTDGNVAQSLTDLAVTRNAAVACGMHGMRLYINPIDYCDATATKKVPSFTKSDAAIPFFYSMGIIPHIEFGYYESTDQNGTCPKPLKDYDFYAIAAAYAARYAPNSTWMTSHGISNWGVTEYSIMNEPDTPNTKFGNPYIPDYVAAVQQMANGVHSVDSHFRAHPGGFGSPAGWANFTANGYCSALASLFNDGTLDGFDLHLYNGSNPSINNSNGIPQYFFDKVKTSSGITADVNFYNTEWNSSTDTVNDVNNGKGFLTSIWANLIVFGNGVPSVGKLRIQSAAPYSLSLFVPTPNAHPWGFGLLTQVDPPLFNTRGGLLQNVNTMLKGMIFTKASLGSAELNADDGRKLYVLENLTNILGTTVTSTTLSNLPPTTTEVEQWYWDGLASTTSVTPGTTSLPFTGLRTGETVMFLARPQLVSVVSRKTHGANGDLDIKLNQQGLGPVVVEPRTNAAGLKIVFTFADPTMAYIGTVSANDGTTPVTGSLSFPGGGTVIATFPTVSDMKELAIRLTGVKTSAGVVIPDVNVAVGLLYGDVNGDSVVDANDSAIVTPQQSGTTLGTARARFDIDLSGWVDSTDNTVVTAQNGHALP